MKKQTVKRVMLKVLVVLVAYHLSLSTSSAQSFLQRLQQGVAGGGKVTVHQDAAIDDLVNGKTTAPAQPAKQESKPAGKQAKATDSQSQQTEKRQTEQQAEKRQAEQQTDTASLDSRRTRQVMGYRIQVFVGGKTRADRQRAEQTKRSLETLFPGQKVYVHFYSPRWICRMGNYRTLDEAREMLDEVVRAGYDTATLVRGKVTVPY